MERRPCQARPAGLRISDLVCAALMVDDLKRCSLEAQLQDRVDDLGARPVPIQCREAAHRAGKALIEAETARVERMCFGELLQGCGGHFCNEHRYGKNHERGVHGLRARRSRPEIAEQEQWRYQQRHPRRKRQADPEQHHDHERCEDGQGQRSDDVKRSHHGERRRHHEAEQTGWMKPFPWQPVQQRREQKIDHPEDEWAARVDGLWMGSQRADEGQDPAHEKEQAGSTGCQPARESRRGPATTRMSL